MRYMQEEIEMVELLLHYCQTVRRGKRPQLAMEAAKWEVRLQAELGQMRKQAELEFGKREKVAA